MNLQLNDPAIPAPGEMAADQLLSPSSPQLLSGSPPTADPHHHRAPSLGELHQELEAEQEAHVVSRIPTSPNLGEGLTWPESTPADD